VHCPHARHCTSSDCALAPQDQPLRPLELYLERYGEPEALEHCTTAQPALKRSYRWVLIIPAFDEAVDFLERVLSNQVFGNQLNALLVIRVINAPIDASASARARTLELLGTRGVRNHGPGIDVLTIDAASNALPADQATGLARKIGNDIACHLMLRGQIKNLLLCNTDADAVLPASYFRQIAAAYFPNVRTNKTARTGKSDLPGALILPFTHYSNEPRLLAAGQLYELYLRRLYENLAWCGSPYAYPALGSVLVINPVLYAKSRGFPKRRAGEDFYLLNKIAKLADIVHLTGDPVALEARASSRVPFGTGPAIEKVRHTKATEFLSYSPASFVLLKRFYSGFQELGEVTNVKPSARGIVRDKLWPTSWQDPDLLWLLKRLGLPTVLKKLQANHPTPKAQRRAVHEWFDALKVVRFLNEARHFHPDEALLKTTVEGNKNELENATEINRQLEAQRSTTRHGITQLV